MAQDTSSKEPKEGNEQRPSEVDPQLDRQGEVSADCDLAAAWYASDSASSTPPSLAGPALEDDPVDPELVKLGRRRRRRHPLISLVVIVLSLYLMYYVRADLVYFFQPSVPRDIGAVSEAIEHDRLQPNTHVTVRGAPDRKHAILLKRQLTGWDSFVRLLQTDNRLYVQRHRRERSVDREVLGVHTGRLVRFESLPYSETVRAYWQKNIRPEHELSFETIARAKRESSQRVRDLKGRAIEISARSEFWLNVSYPGEWVVQLAKNVHPSVDDARRQLSGITLPYTLAEEGSEMFWRFVVIARGKQLEQLLGGFADPGNNAGVVRRQVTYTARWDQLRVDGDSLVIETDQQNPAGRYRLVEGGEEEDAADGKQLEQVVQRPVRVPADALQHASTTSQFEMPADALVLIAGERPDGFWPYLLLYCVLCVFILLNGVALAAWGRSRASGAPRTS